MTPGRRPSQRTRLGRLIDERCAKLGLKLAEVAQRADLSAEALRLIRNGTTTELQSKTKTNLEHALRWASDSIDTIQGGGEPTPLSDGLTERPTPRQAVDPLDEQLGLPLRDEHGDPICDEDGAPLTIARILSTIRYVTRQEGVEAGRRSLRDMGNRFGLPLAHEHDQDLFGDRDMHRVV